MGVKPVRVQRRRGSSAIPPAPVRPTEPTNYKTITTIPLTCTQVRACVRSQRIPLCNSKQSCFPSTKRSNDETRPRRQTHPPSHISRCNRSVHVGSAHGTSDNRDLIGIFKFTRCFQRSTADGQAGPPGPHAVSIVPE